MYTKRLKNNFVADETIIDGETLDWYKMSPAGRFTESQKLWEVFILLGGSYEPEPDSQRGAVHDYGG